MKENLLTLSKIFICLPNTFKNIFLQIPPSEALSQKNQNPEVERKVLGFP